MTPYKLLPYLAIILCLSGLNLNAQEKTDSKENNTLFTAGHASAFIGGLYDGYFTYRQLKQHGDFGLGAPDKIDGELLVLDGKIYRSQANGKTTEVHDDELTPFAVVNFFHADKTLKVPGGMDKDKLYAYLDSVLPNVNGIYAIRIKGAFNSIKTRAFPPVPHKPYVPLAEMLPLQQFFTFTETKGDLVGYRIPQYMEGPNISGYHFHYLSEDKQSGGHIIDLLARDIIIEVDVLNSFTVDLPQTADFENFDLNKDRSEEVRQVEIGNKE